MLKKSIHALIQADFDGGERFLKSAVKNLGTTLLFFHNGNFIRTGLGFPWASLLGFRLPKLKHIKISSLKT